jgi:hypothetical protein
MLIYLLLFIHLVFLYAVTIYFLLFYFVFWFVVLTLLCMFCPLTLVTGSFQITEIWVVWCFWLLLAGSYFIGNCQSGDKCLTLNNFRIFWVLQTCSWNKFLTNTDILWFHIFYWIWIWQNWILRMMLGTVALLCGHRMCHGYSSLVQKRVLHKMWDWISNIVDFLLVTSFYRALLNQVAFIFSGSLHHKRVKECNRQTLGHPH